MKYMEAARAIDGVKSGRSTSCLLYTSIKGTDADNDLAVIAVPLSEIPDDTMSSIAVATMGDSDSVEVGEQVVAIGNALGYGQSVTTGIILSLIHILSYRHIHSKSIINIS